MLAGKGEENDHITKNMISFRSRLLVAGACFGAAPGEELQIGLIGLDTSHVVAFTKALNDRPTRPIRGREGRRRL